MQARLLKRLARHVVLPLLIFIPPIGLALQEQSEADRAAELKRHVIETLNVRPGDKVADVGCGDGFYTLPLARVLGPTGRVYAEDISDVELVRLKQHLSEQQLANVEVIKGTVDDPQLPPGQMDAVLIVNAYHEMTAPEAMLGHVRASLKPGGTFVLMEGIWDRHEGQSRDEQVKHHELAPSFAKQEVQRAGFEVIELRDPFLERTPDED